MEDVAKALVAPGKGILAADASTPTLTKRFEEVGIPSTEETRRAFRELLVTTSGLENFISGVILYDETLRQNAQGKPFVKILDEKGVVPGIKVDQGTEELPGHPGEKITKGLDGLVERLREYKNLGARFTKWRAVYTIGPNTPSSDLIQKNAETLGEYVFFSQQEGLVPIPEPEVLMDGDHDTGRCEEVSTQVLGKLFEVLMKRGVSLSTMILKPNMVLPGKKSSQTVSPEEVAQATVRSLKKVVPTNVPGIVFLSGGQDAKLATLRLNEICKVKDLPWELSFSFERGLEGPAMEVWKGNPENTEAAQKIFLHRAKMNSLARQGKYTPELENE